MLGVPFTLSRAIACHMWEWPVSTLFAAFFCICVVTRIFTGVRHCVIIRNYSKDSNSVTTIPYWIPWLGHTLPFFTNSRKWLSQLSLKVNRGIFTIILGGKKCHIIMSPSLVKEVLSVQAPVDNHEMVGYFMRNVWDDKGAIGSMDKTTLWIKIHRAMYQLNREPFLSRAGDMVTANIEATVFSLVSPSASSRNWQDSANVRWSLSHHFNAEASFFPLIRHYVADMVLPALLGTAFMRNYPGCASDLFTFDGNFHLFLMGLPSCTPLFGMRKSAAARTRLKAALADLHDAIAAASRGEAPSGGRDGRWADLNDVSTVMIDRVRLWEQTGASSEAYVATHAFLVWVTLINANVIIFWLLFHIYRDPMLLNDIRQEISPFANVQKSTNPGEMPTLKLNSRGIRRETPLLQSAFLETMRLYTHSNSFKNVKEDFVVTESGTDEIVRERGGNFTPNKQQRSPCGSGRTYQLHKGDMICVPFGLHQSDPRYWENAQSFNARRFLVLEQSPESMKETDITKKGTKFSVDYNRINPWGVGASVCKGHKFSQREVMEIVVAILMCWDVEPVNQEIGWPHPGLKMAGGTAVPEADFRVKLLRRVLLNA